MRVVIQRVIEASVSIASQIHSKIGEGLVVLACWEEEDTDEDLEWTANKIIQLRIFDDEQGVMNLSVMDTGSELLVVSQFTLYASTKKGNRPSYIRAAKPEISVPLYEKFLQMLTEKTGKPVASGTFGADMQISLVNDGPVTIMIDSKRKE